MNQSNVNSGTIRAPIDPELLGSVTLSPDGKMEAGSWCSFTLTYTAGRYGIDDSGSLRICFRFASDQTSPQLSDPKAPNFTTVEASNGAVLQCRYDPKGNVRPWDRTLYIKVVRGFLKEGETITVRFGATDQGSPGMRLQTFCEATYEFRILVDPVATFNYQPLPVQPTITIVPGPPVRYLTTLPTERRVGEPFSLHIKGEDKWGNPSDRCAGTFALHTSFPIQGLPKEVTFQPGRRFLRLDGLTVDNPGTTQVSLLDADGSIVSVSNPLRIRSGVDEVSYWVDLHGQSEETIGTGSADEYFAFARDLAPVDAVGHQGNDFQITGEFWTHLNALTAAYDEPQSFLAVPGYEWSGNTGLGGDRNVYFPDEGRIIRRSSHALLEDRSDIATDATTAGQLFCDLAEAGEWDVVCFAHCGGRYADIAMAHDGRFEKSIEIHSSWGSFEWLAHDAFDLGYRVGIVANSDGHKGRPGASYPGASLFGAIGGLTCLKMVRLDRSSLFDCLRRRRHYATTGGPSGRLILDFDATFHRPVAVYEDDPALGPADSREARHAEMGDIVFTSEPMVQISGAVKARVGVERVDLFNGRDLVRSFRPYGPDQLGNRIRLLWHGATYRGRFRQVIWDGAARVRGNAIENAIPINFFNPDKQLSFDGNSGIAWSSLTTGNYAGVDIWLREAGSGTLAVETGPVTCAVEVDDVDADDTVFHRENELPILLRINRLPSEPLPDSFEFAARVPLHAGRDNPLYARVMLEDGTMAWCSPVYVHRIEEEQGP